jgi:flagellar basal body P-ring formation protein FlgA
MTRLKRFSMMGLVVGGLLACARVSNGATEICFRPAANVTGPTVTLKDVASVSGTDAETQKRLEQTVLAPAPAPGRSARLEFEDMRSRIEAAGLSTADANYSGSAVVVVSSPKPVVPVVRHPRAKSHVKVSQNQVKRAEKIMTQSVRQSLRGKSREAGHLFLDVVVDPTDVPIILAGATEGFDLSAVDPKKADPQVVRVRTQDSQGQTVRFQIQCVVSEKPQVPVLSHSVTGGEVIREDDLAWKQVDTTEGVLAKFEDIVGKEAKKSLHAEEPLRPDDVRSIPLVRSNDIVTGVWQKGGIRITGQFKAKSDGGKGDVITLVQLTGREQVLARVTDVHEAEIVAGDAVRPTKSNADDDPEDETAAAPVRTVAYKPTIKRKRRPAPPVVDAAGTDNAATTSDAATSAVRQDNSSRIIRDEPSEPTSR